MTKKMVEVTMKITAVQKNSGLPDLKFEVQNVFQNGD